MTLDWSVRSWPHTRLGEALALLARRSGLTPRAVEPLPAPVEPDEELLGEWISSVSSYLGVEAKPVSCRYRELRRFLKDSSPSVIRLPGDPPRYLLVLKGSKHKVCVLGSDLSTRAIPVEELVDFLSRGMATKVAEEVGGLIDSVQLPGRERDEVRALLMEERLGPLGIGRCWLLRLPPGAGWWAQAWHERLPHFLAAFVGAYTLQYLLWIFSWWVIGRGALEGRLEWGWLLGWALVLLTLIPFRMVASWCQGMFAIGAGGLLKTRLLLGALRLHPDEIRHQGAGHHLGRVIESEVVERLTLSGGFLALVAAIELAAAMWVLAKGAGGVYHALLLAAFMLGVVALGRRYLSERMRWAGERLGMSHELIEKMVGHRTRLAQERPEAWHESEDQTLVRYLDTSRTMDRTGAWMSVMPRAWLGLGLAALAAPFVSGETTLPGLAVAMGGTILAYRSLVKWVDGFIFLTDALIGWKQVAPLFSAAGRTEAPGDPSLITLSSLPRVAVPRSLDTGSRTPESLFEAKDLFYGYPDRGLPVLRKCSFRIHEGDRILLESPSGGGKSTLVSLMNGLRSPDSGLQLLAGLDRLSFGAERWTRRIASAPQFHENHVITETFAFNLLMGREWPPRPEDLAEAEALCRELGLGELLERMPSGLLQMVGETGWQLSHGERSRLFLARALLQGADLVVLDESFAALDPESLRRALTTAIDHAPSLLVIAHP